MQVFSDFESGSIGEVELLTPHKIALYLRNDNDDDSLPEKWRHWWYVKLTQVLTDEAVTLHIVNRGHPDYYVPVYSYDQQQWRRFNEQEVVELTQQSKDPSPHPQLTIRKQFEGDTVWIACIFPYPYSKLQTWLNALDKSIYLQRETIGYSPVGEKAIELLTITDFSATDRKKKRIWLHARTHPGETTSNFVLEGLINYLLSDEPEAAQVRARFIFNIVPMHNPDGVTDGNYRSTPQSVDLERSWYCGRDPSALTIKAPHENKLLNKQMRRWLHATADSPAITMALNLHTSNEPPEKRAFFFPHFGADPDIYSKEERALWRQQLAFIKQVSHFYNGRIEPPPVDGGRAYLKEAIPEAWWWVNKQDKVLAMTLETTYGKAGFEHWLTENDLRDLGQALVKAIAAFYS